MANLFVEGKVVLFVGSGVSTEAKDITRSNFYEGISHLIGNSELSRPFPDVMEDFCSTASGKVGLVQQIKERFDYIFAHKSLYDEATRFHNELATFFPIDTIVTTNWDTYFEDECAATPFVDDKDIALWEVADRRVLKLHGTIANFGSIVATRADYRNCARRLKTGILGAHLKSLLATRTVVFIGYSLRDDDFLQIFGAVRKYLSDFHRRAYFVAPDINTEDRARLTALKLHLIETDGQFFVSELKGYAQSKRCICPDEMYGHVASALNDVVDAHIWLHDKFKSSKHPQILPCSWYQDGLQHSLQRIVRLRKTGQHSDLHRLINTADGYEKSAKAYRKLKNYSDSAYCYGYAYGYRYAAFAGTSKERVLPPLFFYFDYLGWSKSDFQRNVSRFPKMHRAAFNYSKHAISKYPKDADLVLDHKDQL